MELFCREYMLFLENREVSWQLFTYSLGYFLGCIVFVLSFLFSNTLLSQKDRPGSTVGLKNREATQLGLQSSLMTRCHGFLEFRIACDPLFHFSLLIFPSGMGCLHWCLFTTVHWKLYFVWFHRFTVNRNFCLLMKCVL